MNKITLSGRLCNDAEMVSTASGKSVAKFNFAVNRRFKQEGKPEADFFQCVAFGKTAETIAQYTSKGTKIILWGEIQNNDYTDDSGQKHYRMQVVVDGFEFCESKAAKSESGTSAPIGDIPGFEPIDNGDELPF
jgi:single-strand DNA-binding protein